jgi:uncharacterized hydrophobic protein (TIGR00271 family)
MVLATLIAAVGILTDSQILIIGAMVVGPEFGPLAGLCVALVQRRLELARRSATALVIGFPVAIAITIVAVLILRAAGPAPDAIAAQGRPATFFIAHPDTFTVLVALLAGVAGLLSLTTAKSGALLGVLISVTTIPAAANVGVATAYTDWSDQRRARAARHQPHLHRARRRRHTGGATSGFLTPPPPRITTSHRCRLCRRRPEGRGSKLRARGI